MVKKIQEETEENEKDFALLKQYLPQRKTEQLPKENQIHLIGFVKRLSTYGMKPNSLKLYCFYLFHLFDATKKNYGQMTLDDLEKFKEKVRHEGISDHPISLKTLKVVRSSFNTFFGEYLRMPEVLTKIQIRDKRRKDSGLKEKVLLKEDIAKIIDLARNGYEFYGKTILGNERDALEIELGYVAGLRINEVCTLKKSEINFERSSVYIKSGKGDKPDTIEIPKEVSIKLKKFIGSKKEKFEYVFFNTPTKGDFKGRISRDYPKRIQRKFSELLAVAGLNSPYNFHMLRHSCASHAIAFGWDLQEVRKHLRHENIETTSTYLHTVRSAMKEKGNPFKELVK